MTTRIVEVTGCSECPNLDSRWTDPPWCCHDDGSLEIQKRHLTRAPRACPLQTKREYLDMERPIAKKGKPA